MIVIKLLNNYLKSSLSTIPCLINYDFYQIDYDKDNELSTFEVHPVKSAVKLVDLLELSYYWPVFFAGIFKGDYITNDIKNKFFKKYAIINDKNEIDSFSDKPLENSLKCKYTTTSNNIYSNLLTNFLSTSNLLSRFNKSKLIPTKFISNNLYCYKSLEDKFTISSENKRPTKLLYTNKKSNKGFPIFDIYFKFIKKYWFGIDSIIRIQITDTRTISIYSNDKNVKLILDYLVDHFTCLFEDIYTNSYLKKFNYLD